VDGAVATGAAVDGAVATDAETDGGAPDGTATTGAPGGATAPARPRRALAAAFLTLAAGLAILPAITGIPYYLVHGGRYHPWSDHALIELQVRAIGHHSVLVGPFSREGWHHPGPAMYYLIAGPYHLLGDSSAAEPLVALLLNAGCVVVAVVLTRRLLGTAAAAGFLVVLAVYLRAAPDGFWRDAWNPYIAVLPLLVAVLACLAALDGRVRWFPVAVGAGSFSVECHVGFVLPVTAVLGLTALLLIVRPAVRRTAPASEAANRWRVPAVVDAGRRHRAAIVGSVVVAVVMWALPVGQQLFGRQGNLTLIWDYLRTHSPTTSRREAVKIVATQLGAVPGYVAGRTPRAAGLALPSVLPAWTGAVALGVFALAAAVAIRLRHRMLLLLAAMTAVVGVTAVIAVSRIVGPVFAYLVTWTAVTGVLLWTTVVATAVVAVNRALARPWPWPRPRPRPTGGRPAGLAGVVGLAGLAGVAGVAALAAIAALAALTVHDTARVATPGSSATGTPGASPDVTGLSRAVRAWLGGAHDHDSVRVVATGTAGKSLVDPTLLITPGVVLDLRKHGADALVDPPFSNAYGPSLTHGSATASWDVFVVYGSPSHPLGGANRLLGRSGDYTVWGERNVASPSPARSR
jgi:hypothetical protein